MANLEAQRAQEALDEVSIFPNTKITEEEHLFADDAFSDQNMKAMRGLLTVLAPRTQTEDAPFNFAQLSLALDLMKHRSFIDENNNITVREGVIGNAHEETLTLDALRTRLSRVNDAAIKQKNVHTKEHFFADYIKNDKSLHKHSKGEGIS